MKLAFFGGVYNNYLALESAIADAGRWGADRLYCLGDLGAFGPHPNRVFPLMHDHDVQCVQGNYDDSIGNELNDCQCGYTDPRDNHFAQISYDYTLSHTSDEAKAWMRQLPAERRFEIDGTRFLLCHGSPRRTNEFLWESTTSSHFLSRLLEEADADVVLGTHTGLHWLRDLSAVGRSRGAIDDRAGLFVNVGVLGRPENDGTTHVWYTRICTGPDAEQGNGNGSSRSKAISCAGLTIEFVPVHYDHERLAAEMRSEGLPDEFVKTILTGWWTTCLEVLPSRERRRGRY